MGANNKISKGQQMPVFEFIDIFGISRSTKEFLGSKWVLIILRDIDCIFCNLYIHQLYELFQDNPKDAKRVVMILDAEPIELKERKSELPFIIHGDLNRELYTKFGLKTSLLGKFKSLIRLKIILETIKKGVFSFKSLFRRNTLPADFLVDSEGKVMYTNYGSHFSDHTPPDVIKNFLTSDS